MSLAPLLAASDVIVVHAFAAMTAFLLGLWQLLAPKGTMSHRALGWIWSALMMLVAGSSLAISTIRTFGPFSAIHLISLFVLIILPLGLVHARRHRVRQHRRTMVSLFAGALVIAGGFTLYPGRIMHAVVFATR